MQSQTVHRERGATIVEIVVALGVVVTFFSGIFLMNSHVLSLLRGSVESTASIRVLQDRAEQLRGSTWEQLTDASHHSTLILAIPPASSGPLRNLQETIAVTAHLAAPGAVMPIEVQRDVAGTVTTTSAGDGTMVDQPSVRLDLTASWLSKGGRPRLRQLSLYLGEGGICGKK